MGAFIEADIGKLEAFVDQSDDVITEFGNIKTEFNNINSTLLSKWEGNGADEYKFETDHILENLQNIKDVLDGMNETLNNIISSYNELDSELGEFNKNPSEGEG